MTQDGTKLVKRMRAKKRPSFVTDAAADDRDSTAVAFSKNLNRYMLAQGWTQADLTRAAQIQAPEGMEIKRHLASSWLRGKHLPSPTLLAPFAAALGVSMHDLVTPEVADVVRHRPAEPVSLNMHENGMSRLRIDMLMPADTALKILALVKDISTPSPAEPR